MSLQLIGSSFSMKNEYYIKLAVYLKEIFNECGIIKQYTFE
jgi:hypothetical protein